MSRWLTAGAFVIPHTRLARRGWTQRARRQRPRLTLRGLVSGWGPRTGEGYTIGDMIRRALAACAVFAVAGCAATAPEPTETRTVTVTATATVTAEPEPTQADPSPTPTPAAQVETPRSSRTYDVAAIDLAAAAITPYLKAGATRSDAGRIAVLVCNLLDGGSMPADVDAELAAQDVGSETPRMWIITMATASLCPAHIDAVQGWAAG